ncbi:YaeQ family protein [Viridibacterium curvum]|uniref:YaeQ family protein n=1 Tax=Viridibacterium curvum TaxID=1101404 RepID=A0ABP9QWB5_9RHOO
MALRSVVYKVDLGISDLDRSYYAQHNLTLARHPSETDERLMVRLLAFVLHASETLEFGKGLSSDDEPALWDRDLTGAVTRWIEVGQPDERLLRRACGKSDEVVLYAYGRAVDVWWRQNALALARLDKLRVWKLDEQICADLLRFADRGMRLQATLQDGELMLSDDQDTVHIRPVPMGEA